LAADSGHDDLVAILLAAHAKPDGPAPDFHGHPPLTAAVKQRCMACVQRLMAAGATIDLRDELGNTALFYTAFAGDAAIAKLLLDAHANPLIANRAGWTPAYNAYYHDKRDVVDALRAAGVRDFNMHDPSP
ncbi:MAG TPA: ankyrin repeat domain-containing protein, partial [Casimicrobiaceae bacterium]